MKVKYEAVVKVMIECEADEEEFVENPKQAMDEGLRNLIIENIDKDYLSEVTIESTYATL